MIIPKRLREGTFDLGGRDAHAIALLQDLVGGDRLAIDPDQVVLGPSAERAGRRAVTRSCLRGPRCNRRNQPRRC